MEMKGLRVQKCGVALKLLFDAMCVILAAEKCVSADSLPCNCYRVFRIFRLGFDVVSHNNGTS